VASWQKQPAQFIDATADAGHSAGDDMTDLINKTIKMEA